MGQLSNPAIRARLYKLHEVSANAMANPPPRRPEIVERRRQRRLAAEAVEELIGAYEDGVTVNELAERFRIHRSTVLDHLNRSTTRRRYPALDARQVEVARKLYESGLSVRDLGLTLNVHASTVRLALLKSGVPMRPWSR